MTGQQQQEQQPAEPEPLERGRYALFETPGGLVIARAAGTCETCQSCGCGTQQPPVELPPVVVKFVKGEPVGPADLAGLLAGSGLSVNPLAMLKGRRGRD